MSNILEELKKWYFATRRNFPDCYDMYYDTGDTKLSFTYVEILVGTIDTLQIENLAMSEDLDSKELLIKYMKKELEQLKEENKQLKEGE